jgi:hypothetical protein
VSLDVLLVGPATEREHPCPDCGCVHVGTVPEQELFSANITHNLAEMAHAAGLYECVWRPDEHGFAVASDITGPLRVGIERMKAEPSRYEALEPSNKWGTYRVFVPWLEEYLAACEAHPGALVRVSR